MKLYDRADFVAEYQMHAIETILWNYSYVLYYVGWILRDWF